MGSQEWGMGSGLIVEPALNPLSPFPISPLPSSCFFAGTA